MSNIAKPRCTFTHQLAPGAIRADGPIDYQCRKRATKKGGKCKEHGGKKK